MNDYQNHPSPSTNVDLNDLGIFVFCKAKLTEIIQLRYDVLIVGTNRTSPEFDGDYDETTHHFAAFLQNRVYCCLTMMRSEYDNEPAYQLRGMATHPKVQGKGIGAKLLHLAEQTIVDETGIPLFWCNARVGYEKFYVKQGWRIVSEPFLIEGVCLHVKMTKYLES